jgi:putative transposase
MARPLRIEYPGAFYHVTCRGNERKAIFADETDRISFVDRLQLSVETYGGVVHSYVLMDNHFHLILETHLGNISELMRHFNVSYTVWFNRRHNRTGHLYQGRYKAILIEADAYLMALSRYVHLNPVKIKSMADMGVKDQTAYLKGYRWSSLRGFLYLRKREPFVNYSRVLDYFGGDNGRGRKAYGAFVQKGITEDADNPWAKVEGQLILGTDGFLDEIKEKFINRATKHYREQPSGRSLHCHIEPERIIEIVSRHTDSSPEEIKRRGRWGVARGMAMELLYRHTRLNQRQIGALMGRIDYSAVSLTRKRFREKLEKDRNLVKLYRYIEQQLAAS